MSRCGRSSMNDVVTRPARKSGSSSTACRNGMFDATPRMRNSATARRARATAVLQSRPRQVSLTSIESKCALISVPANVVPPSSRMPAPPGDRYALIMPVSGRKPLAGILGGDAALQRRATQPDRVLGQADVGERLAGRDAQLRLHQVDVGDLLGDRVLDLDARVHLDEHVVAALVHQELDGAGVDVADRRRERDRVAADALPQAGVQGGRGRDLDDLLVPPLHRAVPLEQVQHGARRRRRGSAPRCAWAR